MKLARLMLLTACLAGFATAPAAPPEDDSLADSVQALLQAHARARPGTEGQAFRAQVQAELDQARRLREAGDEAASRSLTRQAYRRLTLAIRDATQAPAGTASAAGDDAAARQQARRERDLQRRLADAETLLAVLGRPDPTETAAERKVRESRVRQFQQQLGELRELGRHDPEAALQRLDSLYEQEKATIRAFKESDANKRLAPSEAGPAADPTKQRADFDRLDASVGELLAAQARILDAEHPGENPERQVARSARQLRQEAALLLETGQPDAAAGTLRQSYALIQHSVMRLREGRTLIRSLEFDSPREEYDYEVQRHDMHLELAELLMRSRDADPAVGRLGERVLARSRQIRLGAEALAAQGDHAGAVSALEDASTEIYKLFRIAGFYVPD